MPAVGAGKVHWVRCRVTLSGAPPVGGAAKRSAGASVGCRLCMAARSVVGCASHITFTLLHGTSVVPAAGGNAADRRRGGHASF